MNNNAFKDLVRSYGTNTSGSSSKEIARKAVEEEFRKKKRKRSGDADYSSDEDESNRQSSHKKNGRRQQQQQEESNQSDDDAEAIQKDLASRYRDRAKERREGKVADQVSGGGGGGGEGLSNNLLIVPHNKKGLDLALARKERVALQSKFGGENRKSTIGKNMEKDDTQSTSKIRDKLPTLDEAYQVLQTFLSGDKSDTNGNNNQYDPHVTLSNGIAEYLGEIIRWKTLDVSTWEGESSGGTAIRNPLHHTKFSLAIDGNPADATRAWQNPRQYTLSRGDASTSGGSISSPPLISIDLVNNIDRVFRHKNSICEQMMKRNTLKSDPTPKDVKEKRNVVVSEKSDNIGADDDESDEDMFGGLDD